MPWFTHLKVITLLSFRKFDLVHTWVSPGTLMIRIDDYSLIVILWLKCFMIKHQPVADVWTNYQLNLNYFERPDWKLVGLVILVMWMNAWIRLLHGKQTDCSESSVNKQITWIQSDSVKSDKPSFQISSPVRHCFSFSLNNGFLKGGCFIISFQYEVSMRYSLESILIDLYRPSQRVLSFAIFSCPIQPFY